MTLCDMSLSPVRKKTVDWSLLNQYGNLASVLGLVVSALGFSFTWYQVRKSRTAAEKAQAIAQEAVERVSSRLFFSQISTAERLAEEVRSFCRSTEWHRALDRCEQLRVALAGVVDDSRLLEVESRYLLRAIHDLGLISRYLEAIQGKGVPVASRRKMDTLGGIVISLTRIEARMQRTDLEVTNGERSNFAVD